MGGIHLTHEKDKLTKYIVRKSQSITVKIIKNETRDRVSPSETNRSDSKRGKLVRTRISLSIDMRDYEGHVLSLMYAIPPTVPQLPRD